MKTLLVIPPFIQVNTYYPSVTQLSGFLQNKGFEAKSCDMSISVLLDIFSKNGLTDIFNIIGSLELTDISVIRAYSLREKYINTIDCVISYLQGKNNTFASRLASENYLPQGESFTNINYDSYAFGSMGIMDKAKYYCSLYLDDLSLIISRTISPNFGFSRYAEKLAVCCSDFGILQSELNRPVNYIERLIELHTDKIIREYSPGLIGYTIPFPGNLLGALISARYVKRVFPHIKIVFGGGYVNTELRSIKDCRIFNYTDFIAYDDGEIPLLNILKNIENPGSVPYVRTLILEDGNLKFENDPDFREPKFNELTGPSTAGIIPGNYFSMTELLNPMHRLWSDGFWNKITAAHGCYWHRCAFCDTTLDYICTYSPSRASSIVDIMERLIKETGRNSFHFTDEAAPPSLLRDVAIEIIRRKLSVVWWGNIRFEKSFTPDLCRLMALSGCIAVSGGIEAAGERLLKLINKGITVQTAAEVLKNFTDSGILTHTYLMFGFPTETENEIIDSLEIVRQLFSAGIVRSAFWHRFSLTVHSPIFNSPEKFEISLNGYPQNLKQLNPFANNDIYYEDFSGIDYSRYSFGLNKALYNYLHGIGLDWDLQKWFEFRIPETNIRPELVENCISVTHRDDICNSTERTRNSMVIWTGTEVRLSKIQNNRMLVESETNEAGIYWETETYIAEWIKDLSVKASLNAEAAYNFDELIISFPSDFSAFRNSEIWKEIRDNLLLII